MVPALHFTLRARILRSRSASRGLSTTSQNSSSQSGWTTVIGLELHCQLKSRTKLFSHASTRFDDPPNTNVALFDAALPGSLPKLNPEPLRLALLAALALNCKINLTSRFDRKHYLYHDLPPGFQITQKYRALAHSGHVVVDRGDQSVEIGIEQLQMEQDTAKTTLDPIQEEVLVDLNRAGVPLIEIISKPELRSAAEAGQYVNKVRDVLRCVGASDGDMDKGSLRIDVNVSVKPKGTTAMGTRCEIKNLNSVRFMMQAIDYEVNRQIGQLTANPPQPIEQETRRYDAFARETIVLRSKDDAPDYRYMPDPELPPLVLPQDYIDHLRSKLPELPAAIHARLQSKYGLAKDAVERLMRVESATRFAPAVKFFEAATSERNHRVTANWIVHDLLGLLAKRETSIEETPVSPQDIRALVLAIVEGRLTVTQGKSLLVEAVDAGASRPLQQLITTQAQAAPPASDGLELLVDQVIAEHPKEVERFQKGQTKLLTFFVGRAMRASQGRADAKALAPLFQNRLGVS